MKNTADLQRLEFGRGFGYKKLLSIGMQDVASVMQTEIVSHDETLDIKSWINLESALE